MYLKCFRLSVVIKSAVVKFLHIVNLFTQVTEIMVNFEPYLFSLTCFLLYFWNSDKHECQIFWLLSHRSLKPCSFFQSIFLLFFGLNYFYFPIVRFSDSLLCPLYSAIRLMH